MHCAGKLCFSIHVQLTDLPVSLAASTVQVVCDDLESHYVIVFFRARVHIKTRSADFDQQNTASHQTVTDR